MGFDYSGLAQTAVDLLNDFGRTITLVKLNQTTSDDPAKPWRGTANPRLAPAASVSVTGVMVDGSSVRGLGFTKEDMDNISRGSKVFLVAGAATGTDLIDFHEIVDGTNRYRIASASVLKPGSTTILYGFVVKG